MRNYRYFYSTLAGASLAATAVISRPDDFSRLKENVQAHFYKNDSVEKRRLKAIRQASTAVKRFMVVNGIPGVSVGVSVNGENVWSEGFGFGDVEIGTKCQANSVMRIASISKAITSIIAAKLIETEKLDLDKSIYDYLPDFPRKRFDNEQVNITTRQLFCHMGGIRHYPEKENENKRRPELSNNNEESVTPDSERTEFHSNNEYKSVTEALHIFKNDPLVTKPGMKFYYTTHGFTVISAILEKCSQKPFPTLVRELFEDLGMHNSSIDKNRGIVANRCKYYMRNKNNCLENVPEVDNSCKWAGGGLISNVEDLLLLANTVLYSYQSTSVSQPPPYLKRETVEKLWNIETKTKGKYYYGLGWMINNPKALVGGVPESQISGFCFHTGAAVGVSSILLLKPSTQESTAINKSTPRGICVAILANCENSGAGITDLARYITEQFE